ncbi:MAG: phosphatidylserine decarboxylase [Synergistaceae bacterium]|jgi:phosphatidylserine decarboxylase|nr:phosphatidylserine decarboxylase [Synergistaceae bacterium]
MRLARDGFPTIGALALLAVAAFFLSPVASCVLLFPLAVSLWFYRDPDRTPEGGPDAWVSPADGRVIEIEEDAVDPYAGRATKIGIFMNGFDVHVNRFPAAGTVEEMRYVPGKKWFVLAPKSSLENERLYVGIMTEQGRTTLVQIAGIMARRVVCRVKVGSSLARGERYGMIKLGSKVDVYLPRSVRPAVKVGDAVRAGESKIGVVE